MRSMFSATSAMGDDVLIWNGESGLDVRMTGGGSAKDTSRFASARRASVWLVVTMDGGVDVMTLVGGCWNDGSSSSLDKFDGEGERYEPAGLSVAMTSGWSCGVGDGGGVGVAEAKIS